MSCTIIKERHRETYTEYHREFTDEFGSGYSFPCSASGEIDDSDWAECAKENYRWALAHPEEFEIYNEVKKFSRSYTEPALARCSCGNEFSLVDEYMGACECEKCGSWYNMFGQSLVNPKYWEDNIDEDW